MKRELEIIAGPCAGESIGQIEKTIAAAKIRGIETVRASLWKPRTRPGGFEGLGLAGLELLGMIADAGLVPATEVMRPGDAERIAEEIVGKHGGRVLWWTGARTGVGQLIGDIALVARGEEKVRLMIKNPMEKDKEHWLGMVEYAVEGCGDPSRVMICHRGFAPRDALIRNPPDIEMALEVRGDLDKRFGMSMPLIVDPSHICGRSDLVKLVVNESLKTGGVDGFIIEVHPEPERARTDSNQQITWEQFDQIMADLPIRRTIEAGVAV